MTKEEQLKLYTKAYKEASAPAPRQAPNINAMRAALKSIYGDNTAGNLDDDKYVMRKWRVAMQGRNAKQLAQAYQTAAQGGIPTAKPVEGTKISAPVSRDDIKNPPPPANPQPVPTNNPWRDALANQKAALRTLRTTGQVVPMKPIAAPQINAPNNAVGDAMKQQAANIQATRTAAQKRSLSNQGQAMAQSRQTLYGKPKPKVDPTLAQRQARYKQFGLTDI